MHPAIFLDRDGVLIENRPNYVRDWSEVRIFPEAVRALCLPAIKAYKIVIVTNQSAIGRGLVSRTAADEINRRLVDHIRDHGGQVDAVYVCPHSPEDNCLCRKPKPGLLLQAAGEMSLDLGWSWMIGDAWSDAQAGQAAGVRQAILVRTGRALEPEPGSGAGPSAKPLVVADLAQALETILATRHTPAADADPSRR